MKCSKYLWKFVELQRLLRGESPERVQGELRSMIGQTIFAVSDNESRPIHTGALFETEGDRLTMVAVDGYRLALRRGKLAGEGPEGLSFVVPGAALNEVEKICADSDEPAAITQGDRHVTFEIGGTLLVARRLEGEFLNYRQTIPQNNSVILEADCAERYGYDPVCVVPRPKAGGSFATQAWRAFARPTAVEHVRAHAGLDIGGTLIGMHLREVAVPVRLSLDHVGAAILLCARTRPRYIGGARAAYE